MNIATARSPDGLFSRGESGSLQLTGLCLPVPSTDPAQLYGTTKTFPKKMMALNLFLSKHTSDMPREMKALPLLTVTQGQVK